MDKQYKVRYGDNQHTKVATQNMLPVNSQVIEAKPEDINVDTEDIIEEDTGLTQQIRTVNPSPTLTRGSRYRPPGCKRMAMVRRQ